MQKNIAKIMELTNIKYFERNPRFQKELIDLNKKTRRFIFKVSLSETEILMLTELYFKLKEERIFYLVNRILQQSKNAVLKSFFLGAYEFRKPIDMKFDAIRGYLSYATEEEAAELLKRFELKLKRASLDYTKYECLVSVYGFPYLIKKYRYKSLRKTYDIVLDNYHEIPELLRGIFTLDKYGEVISLVTREEASSRIHKVLRENKPIGVHITKTLKNMN